jgi:hypothetical protein
MDLDYNTRLAAIQRNEKLAQIMQQQAFQPVDVQSYQGIQAPISPLSGLAKVLQAYMGAKGTGDEERIKLNQEAKAQAQQMLGGLQDRPASPGRAAVMGMPEIQAQPATSFTPMGADFEDNPNLQTAPSGNVETPAVAYQPAVAPQAAIPPQAAVSLDPDQKRAKLVEIMMGQNPYASPIAKLEYERLGKQESGPLAEYRLAQQQGYTGTIDQYKTQQAQAGRSITSVNVPSSMAPMFVRNKVTGKNEYVQPDNRGKFDMANYEPIEKGTDLRQQLADAGIFPTLPDGSPNPEFTKYAKAALEKTTTQVISPNASATNAAGVTTQAAPPPSEGMINVKINGVQTAIPIAQASELNAKFKGAEKKSTEQAAAEFDLVTVSKDGKDILMPRASVINQANKGNPALAKPDVKTTQGQTVLDVAKRAEIVLPKASSGIISNLFTMATDAAGIPTDKSAADAQLRVLGGQLTLAQPRMEGPQSNADSILYQQMAASVANPNVPYQTRMKALNTVIELNEKYAATPSAPPPGSVRRITPK